MKKLVCILMAAMMLVLCGCESSDENSSTESGANTSASVYTQKLSIDNVSFCVPEDCEEKAGDNTIKYYYYPDGGFIMTSYYDNDYQVSIHNDSLIEGLTSGMSTSSGVENFSYEKKYINNIPILEIKMEMHYSTQTAYCYSIYLISDKHMVSFGISSYVSLDDAEEKCNALVSTIKIDNQTNKEDSGTNIITKKEDDSSIAEPREPEKSFSKFTVSGTGSKVTKDISLPPVLCVVHAEHSGSRNFIVHYYSESGNRSSLANEIGIVDSYQVFDAQRNNSTDGGMLEVDADGRWNLTFIPLADYVSSSTKTSFSGRGDAVVGCFTANGVTVCKGTHRGDRNFIVHVYEYSETGDRLASAFNEIGTYSGETVLRTKAGKKYFFNVVADGSWTLDLE